MLYGNGCASARAAGPSLGVQGPSWAYYLNRKVSRSTACYAIFCEMIVVVGEAERERKK